MRAGGFGVAGHAGVEVGGRVGGGDESHLEDEVIVLRLYGGDAPPDPQHLHLHPAEVGEAAVLERALDGVGVLDGDLLPRDGEGAGALQVHHELAVVLQLVVHHGLGEQAAREAVPLQLVVGRQLLAHRRRCGGCGCQGEEHGGQSRVLLEQVLLRGPRHACYNLELGGGEAEGREEEVEDCAWVSGTATRQPAVPSSLLVARPPACLSSALALSLSQRGAAVPSAVDLDSIYSYSPDYPRARGPPRFAQPSSLTDHPELRPLARN